MTITDSLNVGELQAAEGVKQIGTVVGALHNNGTLTLNQAYGAEEFNTKLIGYRDQGTLTGNEYMVRKLADLEGFGAYQFTKLDFNSGTWVLMKGTPRLGAFASAELSLEDAKTLPDYSWYDANAATHTINGIEQMLAYADLRQRGDFVKKSITLNLSELELSTEKQLRAFAALCADGADFAGKTVKLSNDVTLTETWAPGTFNGTFDGQGHTISGLTGTGLFSALNSGAVVMNLKVNCELSGGTVGGIAAESKGATITCCWVTGTVSGDTAGGIVGIASEGTTTVAHCRVEATVTGTTAGDLVGKVTGTANLGDSLVNGTAAVGSASENTTTTNVYTAEDKLKGYGAYQWTALDFDGGYWVLKADAIPVLGVFDTTDLDMADAKTLPDYTWYSETAENYVLSTARQLHGYILLKDTIADKTVTLGASEYGLATADQLLAFNALSADVDYFADKTVKLSDNIVLIGGSATNANWTPVSIKGTFDGQGYSISGAYVKADTQYTGLFHTVYTGAAVRNLKLTDSYIEGNGSETRSGVGSIAGRNYGTIDTVYSSATVKNSKQMTGGIVGMSFGGTITNCWFDGTIHGMKATGGILGGTYNNTALMSHCLFTGTIIDGYNSTKALIGGLCGYAQNSGSNTASVTIRDSLSAGTLQSSSTSQIGAIVGGASKAMTIGNVYAATDTGFGSKNYGWTGVAPVLDADSEVVIGATETLYGTGAAKLDFNTWWTARDGMIPMLKSFS